jgi:Ca2+-binding RTX toxin-like protein
VTLGSENIKVDMFDPGSFRSSVSASLGANAITLQLLGEKKISAKGNGLDNVLIGNGANNSIEGGGGDDEMRGGRGNDTYSVGSARDVVIENAGEGIDTVRSSASYVLGANVEHLVLASGKNIGGTGNALPNTMTGNTGNNVLKGGEGNDTFRSGSGTDQLYGQQGNDRFIFNSAAETGVGVMRDSIRGFEAFGDDDTIDLSGFAGTLTFSDASSFSGTLNEVIAIQSGAHVIIQINTSGDIAPDAEIMLTNTTRSEVTASDFDLV